jgi:hypothetical protein
MMTLEPLVLPENNTDTQPPPATALLDELDWRDVEGTDA